MVAASVPPTRYNAGYDETPDAYDELRASGHMARRRLEHVAAVVAGTSGPVLEVGCGTGTLLRALAGRFPDRRFTGVEPLANYVAFAAERAAAQRLDNLDFRTGTAERLADVAGDVHAALVLSVDTLHHVRDGAATVRSIAAVSRPGARWHALEPDRRHPYVWLYHSLTPGERTFPVRSFLQVAASAGWRLERRGSLFAYPGGVPQVPAWADRLERRLERVPVLAGAVVLDLVRDAPSAG